jgi:Tfp pilus assembly protein PilF
MPCPPLHAQPRLALLTFTLTLALSPHLAAAPRVPGSDTEVLARVPARAVDPRARDLQQLRAAWRANPRDAGLSARLAARYVEQAGADGDPRYVGYAQAVLAPWWNDAAPPVAVRVQRAVLRQYAHQFTEALADLDAAVQVEPANAQAWAWLAAIHMVRADYADAARACRQLAPLTSALLATGCSAAAAGLTGHAAEAMAALQAALQTATDAAPEERLWVLTRLGELAERRGDVGVAERAFKEALALGLDDVYLQAAYADFLLDRGRAAEVLLLLKDGARADVLLLRLALAAKASADPRAAGWARELAARFAAARARGDQTHEKEEARFLLLQGDAKGALALARSNFAVQREAADARILLEAALATGEPAAAAPVRNWLETHRVESVVLRALASRLGAAR